MYVRNNLEFTNGMFKMSILANHELLSNLVRELAIISIRNKNLFQKYLILLQHHKHSQYVRDQRHIYIFAKPISAPKNFRYKFESKKKNDMLKISLKK